MKANEAPERIWIDSTIDLPKLSGHIDKDSVEYVRIDAFMKKVCDYLMEYELNDSPTISDRRKRIDDFKNYMKNNF
jgi:hypothetical protein